ncbi:MAG: TIGR03087 family PEP-CTERM/XrtA system glycosyltransferase [Desulfobacula sp.]
MKILYLAHRIPYPPNKGDKIRTFNEIKYLSESHEIHLLTLADNPGDMKYQDHLKKYCKQVQVIALNTRIAKLKSMMALVKKTSFSVVYFYSKQFQKILDDWLSTHRYDAVICFSSPMAEYLFRSPAADRFFTPLSSENPANAPVLIMDYCDLDSQKWCQYAKNSRFPLNLIYRMENLRLFEYEKQINRRFHHSVFVSETEVALFRDLYPDARNLTSVPNGVDQDFFSSSERVTPVRLREKENQPVLVFTGAMDYYANIDGVTWFCHEIFPLIKKECPDALFYIVGSNPATAVKDLETIQGVRVTGFVEDIRPYYQYADICVIPLRIAAGVQNKILEAMAMGKPVVTTSRAFDGINGRSPEHAMVGDSPEQFSNAVLSLLKDEDKRTGLGKNANHFVRQAYDWKINMKRLENLI